MSYSSLSDGKRNQRRLMVAMTALTALLFTALCGLILEDRLLSERQEAARHVSHDIALRIDEHLRDALSVTYALGALVYTAKGDTSGFEGQAKDLLSYQPGISSLALAPKAVVRHIHPLKGNEQAIGHDLLADPARSVEARRAIETRLPVLSGPFALRQGGEAVVVRLPIFLESAPDEFWGFAISMVHLDDLFKKARLGEFAEQGFSYELWRFHPDTNERHVFARSAGPLAGTLVRDYFDVPNGRWFLDLTPVAGWVSPTRIAGWAFLSLLAGLLAGWVARARLHALDAVTESEARHRWMFETVSMGVVYMDRGAAIVSANPAAGRILGLARDAMEGRRSGDSRWRAIHPDGSPFPGEEHPSMVALRTGLPVRDAVMGVFNPVREKIVWLNVNAMPLLDEAGEVVQVYVTFEDISEHRRAEAAEAAFRGYFNMGTVAMCITSPETGWLEVNDRFCRMLGYSREEATRMTWPEMTHPEDLEADLKLFNQVMAGERDGYELEKRFLRKDGTVVHALIWVACVRNPDGSVHHFLASVTDITALIRAEESLRESEARIREVLEVLPVGVWIADKEGRITHGNAAGRRIWAGARYVGPDEFKEYKAWWVTTGEPVKPEEWGIARAIARGESSCEEELEIECFDGTRKIILNWAVPIRGEGGVIEGAVAVNQDITERKQVEQTLRDSERHLGEAEAQLRLTLDTVAEGIYGTDLVGRCTFVNPAALEILGYGDPAELLGRDMHETIHPTDIDGNPLPKSACPMHQCIERGEINSEEEVFTRADGSRFPVWMHARAMYREGEAVGAVVSFMDIGARKEMESLLRREQARAQQYLDLAGVMMVAIGADQRVTMINRKGAEVLGYAVEEVVGHNWFDDFLPEGIGAQVKGVFERLVRGEIEPVEHSENPVRTRSGEERLIAWNNTIVRDDSGVIAGILGSGEDITERRRMEVAVQESEARFRHFFERNSSVMVLIEPESGRIVTANGAAARYYGFPPGELERMSINQINTLLPEQVAQERLRALREECNHFNFRHRLAAGEVRDVEVYSTPVNVGGAPLLFSIVHDITERRRMEDALRSSRDELEQRVEERTGDLALANQALAQAKEVAEAANRAKSLFLANMSHELRTPLNAVLGFSEMMAHDTAATPDQQRKLAIINRSGGHLLEMINDVLDLSKIEAGAVELEPETFDPAALLEDLGQMFLMRAQTAGLRFRLELAPGLARSIVADSGKLRHILINLLGNAVKFTRFGEVTLRAGSEPLPGDPDQILLHIEVQDSGPGIPPDQRERIFEPFVQAGRTSDTKGTGLGLAITRTFVRLMGGSIAVDGAPGEGARFRVELPVTLAEGEAPEAAAEACTVVGLAPGEPAWRILVVEDNPDSRLLLRGYLAPAGFEVLEAVNGVEAIALFERWRPHFIWMDMRMPVMDGFDATRTIRGLPGGDAVKIVALTAHVFKDQDERFVEAGCDEVIHKPFRAAELFAAMARHLGVRYLYAEPSAGAAGKPAPTLTAAMLERLPQALRDDLYRAACILDADGILGVIDEIQPLDEEAAAALRELVQNFRFEHILMLLGGEAREGGAPRGEEGAEDAR